MDKANYWFAGRLSVVSQIWIKLDLGMENRNLQAKFCVSSFQNSWDKQTGMPQSTIPFKNIPIYFVVSVTRASARYIHLHKASKLFFKDFQWSKGIQISRHTSIWIKQLDKAFIELGIRRNWIANELKHGQWSAGAHTMLRFMLYQVKSSQCVCVCVCLCMCEHVISTQHFAVWWWRWCRELIAWVRWVVVGKRARRRAQENALMTIMMLAEAKGKRQIS